MINRLAIVVSVLFTLVSNTTFASTPDAPLSELAKQKQWHHLLHYHEVGLFSTYESQVDDPSFFLSENGKTDPLAELKATLNALDKDSSVQCKFPARYHWLKQQLPERFKSQADQACPKFQTFYDEIAPAGLTLVFPAAYLNSPSSMFGHTLMRIDSARHKNPLLDYSINYAANADPSDNELVFSYKGLTGGYPGVFSVLPYYEKVKEYNHLESRDVWEYQLDIQAEELQQFVRHIWEVKDVHFDYYFFTENCSYHLLTLMDAASERFDLSDHFSTNVIPADTVRVLNRAGMIQTAEFRPSSLSTINAMRAEMSPAQQEVSMSLNETRVRDVDLSLFSELEQAQVLDLAYRYSRHGSHKKAHQDSDAKRSLSLLSQRSKNPTTEAFSPFETPEVRDDQGHLSHRLQFGMGRLQDENRAQFGLRMAYHDWLDPLAGYVSGAQLEMIHFKAGARLGDNKGLQLDEVRMIDIRSLTPRDDFFQPTSWFVSTGLRRPSSQIDELGPYLNGGFGLSYSSDSLERNSQLFSLLLEQNLYLDNDIDKGHHYSAGPTLLWINPQDSWSSTLRFSHLYDLGGAEFASQEVELGVSYSFHQDWQIRMESAYQRFRSAEDHDDHDLKTMVSLMRYF